MHIGKHVLSDGKHLLNVYVNKKTQKHETFILTHCSSYYL